MAEEYQEYDEYEDQQQNAADTLESGDSYAHPVEGGDGDEGGAGHTQYDRQPSSDYVDSEHDRGRETASLGDGEAHAQAPPSAQEDYSTNPAYQKYVTMRKMLPEGPVRQKMMTDGFTPSEIDAFFGSDGGPYPAAPPRMPAIPPRMPPPPDMSSSSTITSGDDDKGRDEESSQSSGHVRYSFIPTLPGAPSVSSGAQAQDSTTEQSPPPSNMGDIQSALQDKLSRGIQGGSGGPGQARAPPAPAEDEDEDEEEDDDLFGADQVRRSQYFLLLHCYP